MTTIENGKKIMQRYEKDCHIILHADVFEGLRTIPDQSIDLIFCDPPYNIGKNFHGRPDKWESDEAYLTWCYGWIDQCIEKLKPHGSLYMMAATQNMPYLDIYLRRKLTILSRIVWCYDSSGVQAKNYFGSLYEPILHCVKDKNHYTFNAQDILVEAKTGAIRKLIDYRKSIPTAYNTQKVPGNVWQIPRVRYRMPEYEEHPTQKPVALLERIISASSHQGDCILDPFSGTFTTSFVAKQLGRTSIGIEIEERYIKIGLRRLDICAKYQGETLYKPIKTYREGYNEQPVHLTLFEDTNGTSLYEDHFEYS